VWVKLGDEMPDRPSIWRLSHGAFRLHVSGLAYSNRMLLEGVIPRDRVPALVPSFRPALVEELVAGGVWRREGDDYRILDSADDQLTRADVIALRDKRAAAGRKGGLVSGKKRRKPKSYFGFDEATDAASNEANASSGASSKREANGNPGPVPGLRVQTDSYISSSSNGHSNEHEVDREDGRDEGGALSIEEFLQLAQQHRLASAYVEQTLNHDFGTRDISLLSDGDRWELARHLGVFEVRT
jgi:hypothetical protein